MTGWAKSLSALPGAIVSVLPSATCPACLGAYAGLVSALGVGYFFRRDVLIPVIVVFLVLGIVGAFASKRRHRHSGPLVTTVCGSAAVVAGKLIWDIPLIVDGGAALLFAAATWNVYLTKVSPRDRLVRLTTR